MKEKIVIFLVFSLIFTATVLCSNNNKEVSFTIESKNGYDFVFNNQPEYTDIDFIDVIESKKIKTFGDNYNISFVNDIEIDEENNIYVLSQFEGTINVFSNEGDHIRKLGGKGQGPQELENPAHLTIYSDKLYIYEQFKGIKIWDLSGNYLQSIPAKSRRELSIKMLSDEYLITEAIFNRESKGRKYNFLFASPDLENTDEIFNIELEEEDALFFYPEFTVANSDNKIYFPAKCSEYIINEYNSTGKLIRQFGRKYDPIPFSNEAKEDYDRRFGDPPPLPNIPPNPEMPEYPPVIRKIIVDSKKYIWVIVGEMHEDNKDTKTEEIESIIDIYNENGRWLYSFRTTNISMISVIKDQWLYSVSKITNTNEEQTIKICKINYLQEN